MVQFQPPAGGPWNPLRMGGSKAISLQLRAPLGGHQAAAVSASSETASLRAPRPRKGASLKSSALELLQKFPLKVACTAGSLSLAGDTIAQVMERYKRRKALKQELEGMDESFQQQELAKVNLGSHDFWRALRMGSYGFLLYAPGTQLWYESLDRIVVGKSLQSISLKVLANQLILGPAILVVVFGWNYFWMGKLRELPDKYRRDMGPSIVNAWKFWMPATCLNFWAVPLNARVAFMSTCGVFWNFYLSSNIGK